MTITLIIIAIVVLLYFLLRTPKNPNGSSQVKTSDTYINPEPKLTTNTTINDTKSIVHNTPKRMFDKLDINGFMGFVLKETTSEQVVNTLNAEGSTFGEYPDFSDPNQKSISFTYRAGDIDWSCSMTFKNNILCLASLNNYNPNSYKTFQIICNEMSERFCSLYNIRNSKDRQEGTETMTFEKKDDPCQFTEIVYDSSPILGQKNIYIKYWKF